MTTLYVTEERAFIRKKGGTLLIQIPDQAVKRIPLEQVTEVILCGDVSFSGAALRELCQEGIGLGVLGPRDEWVGRWEPTEPKTILLRRAQFRAADNPTVALAIAKPMVAGKIRSCRGLLLRARRENIAIPAEILAELAELRQQALEAPTMDHLRGVEGQAAARYFPAYGGIVSTNGFSFRARVRRPPNDPVNSMLSFGYALLTHATSAAVRSVGFDAYLGYLHAVRYGRPSLALDLMEEFRPIIVDALVAAIIRLRVLTPSDFTTGATECRLKDEARRVFLKQFERKLASTVRHPVLDRQVSHRRAIEIQARLLAKVLLGEIPSYIPFSKR